MLNDLFIISPKSIKLKDLDGSNFFYYGRIYHIISTNGNMRVCCYYEDDSNDLNSTHTIFHYSVLVHSVDKYN